MSGKKLRCAIYTRKSSEEGLDQHFNSLDAQREACAAYILSQAGEGWSPINAVYDDAGYSGGSMERPALVRLMADIQAGRIDIVVVYKVDRLTRSLADFARIVEILDRAGASFVSVTQAFNTTTSMGRLTLNVLLSFAQFEREVTGERIRDKIAASKARGMWMGGHPPLGYDIKDRALHINPTEAEIVRGIFRSYLELRSVIDLRDALASGGIRSKRWITKAGRTVGGLPFSHGALFHVLSSRLYLGEIVHRDRTYPGQHEAVVDAALFAAVQEKLKAGAPPMPGKRIRGYTLPFLGKLFDDAGGPMTSAHANKKGRRYLYYVSSAHVVRKAAGGLPRVSAPRLQKVVVEMIVPLLAPAWLPEQTPSQRVTSAIHRIVLGAEGLEIEVARVAISECAAASAKPNDRNGHWLVSKAIRLGQAKHSRRVLASEMSATTAPRVERSLVRAVVMARRWAEMLATGEAASIQDLAARENICPLYTGQLLPLAYLAPDLVEMILDGRQPERLSLNALVNAPPPLEWSAQRAHFARFA